MGNISIHSGVDNSKRAGIVGEKHIEGCQKHIEG